MNKVYQELFKRADEYLDTRQNNLHTNICYQFALNLIRKEGGDPTVVLPAIILHDVGWKMVPENLHSKGFGLNMARVDVRRKHEVEGSKIARRILESSGYEADKISKICEIVLFHDSRAEGTSLEDSLVKDADKLWRISHFGLRIEPERQHISVPDYLRLVGQLIGQWYLTPAGKDLAKREFLQRMFELEIGAL